MSMPDDAADQTPKDLSESQPRKQGVADEDVEIDATAPLSDFAQEIGETLTGKPRPTPGESFSERQDREDPEPVDNLE